MILRHICSSLELVGGGLAASLLIATIINLALATLKSSRFVLFPVLLPLRYTPVAALIPLLIAFVGIGYPLGVSVIVLGCAPSMTLQFWDISTVETKRYYHFLRNLGVSRSSAYFHGAFRGSLPRYVRCVRVMAGWAWSYVILAELIGVGKGLGYMIQDLRRWGFTGEAFLVVLLVAGIGFVIDIGFSTLLRHLPAAENLPPSSNAERIT